jgi:hypothetical protein
LAAKYGKAPDDWQAEVITAWLSRKADGLLAAGRCGVSVPRQNGKNAILEIVELFKLVVQGRQILHTAHEVKTARKAFDRIKEFFTDTRNYPELAALVKVIRQTNGQEAIRLTNGASIEFIARSRGSGRGFTVDDLVMDEAQELTDEQLAALMPTISSAPSGDPQIIMTGTPPPPGADGQPYRRMREAAVLAKDKRLSWHEWSPATLPARGDRKALLAAAQECNPALGIRLNWSVVRDELASLGYDEYLRERLGAWDVELSRSQSIILPDQWAALATDTPPDTTNATLAYAVKFSADGARVGLGGAIKPADGGPIFVETIGVGQMRNGTASLVRWLADPQRWGRGWIILDGAAGVADLRTKLIEAGVPRRRIIEVNAREAVAAHAGIFAAIVEAEISHSNQGALNTATTVAGTRKIGVTGGWGWKSIDDTKDITPLDAVTLARHFAATKRPLKPPGRGRN